MGEDGQSLWRYNGPIADQIEPAGSFQIGDDKKCRRVRPEKPERIGEPAYDPKSYEEAGCNRNDDKKFQILRLFKRELEVLGPAQNTQV
jgi:hypothetical protein